MRTSGKLVASVSLVLGLATVAGPVNALGDIVAVVEEGQQVGLIGFTVTNNNSSAVTLTGLASSVNNPHFDGPDPDDFVTLSTLSGGTCLPLRGVVGGLGPKATCTVNLTISTPPPDVGGVSDYGVSQLTLDVIFDNGPVSSLKFEVQVNDASVPEPGSATLAGLGIAALLGASYVARKRELIQNRPST
jgi:PEP-CTERM motif